MKRLAILVPVLLVTTLASCAPQDRADPMVTCIDVNVEYGLAADRVEARDLCEWLVDHESLLGDQTFEETFSSPDLAREWAEAEAAKGND